MHPSRLAALPLLVLTLGIAPAHATDLYDITQLYKKGKKEEALYQLDSYLTNLPKDSWGRNVTQARLLRGVLLSELGQRERALQVFTRLTLDYPDLPEAYNNLAVLYAAEGNYEAARDTLERGMRIDPAFSAMHANLGDIYAKLSERAYDATLQASGGKNAPTLVKELCDNYGGIARQAAGRNPGSPARSDLATLQEIQPGRTAAAKPPAHVDIDEMALPTPSAAPRPAKAAGKSQAPEKAGTGASGTAAPKASASREDPSVPQIKDEVGEPVAAPAADDPAEHKRIISSVNAWAAAWSDKRVSAYLAHYAPGFRPPDGGSRAQWAEQRRERISKPKSIRVTISAPQVTMIGQDKARVSFRQSYRSDTLQTSGSKTLIMVRSGKQWLIQEEKVGG